MQNILVIGHVRYINIQAWLRGFRVKIAIFLSFFCPSILKRDLDTMKTTPNIGVCPESLGAMLEYWYIERGQLTKCSEIKAVKKFLLSLLLTWHLTASNSLWTLQSLHFVNKTLLFNFLPSWEFFISSSIYGAWNYEFSSSWGPFYVASFSLLITFAS